MYTITFIVRHVIYFENETGIPATPGIVAECWKEQCACIFKSEIIQ